MDLVRTILLQVEERAANVASDLTITVVGHSSDEITYHVGLLHEAGLVHATVHVLIGGDAFHSVQRLTWSGHEFLETVRDPEIWRRTKEGAAQVGGWSFGILKDLGAAYVKHLAKERLGIDI
jgi:hypothetical protein